MTLALFYRTLQAFLRFVNGKAWIIRSWEALRFLRRLSQQPNQHNSPFVVCLAYLLHSSHYLLLYAISVQPPVVPVREQFSWILGFCLLWSILCFTSVWMRNRVVWLPSSVSFAGFPAVFLQINLDFLLLGR